MAILFLLVWIMSIWWTADWGFSRKASMGISRGGLRIEVANHQNTRTGRSPGWSFAGPGCEAPTDRYPMLWWARRWERMGASGFDVPLIAPMLIAVGVALVGWRLNEQARRCLRENLCAGCGYSLTGLAPGATCPECGKLPAAA